MQGKQIKGQFIWRTGEDRRKVVESIKEKINSGYFFSDKVVNELVEKLGPQFAESVGD